MSSIRHEASRTNDASPQLGWRVTLIIWLMTGFVVGLVVQVLLGQSTRESSTWLDALLLAFALGLGAILGQALPRLARSRFR